MAALSTNTGKSETLVKPCNASECRHTVNERIMQEQFLSTREKLNYNLLEVHFRSNLKSSNLHCGRNKVHVFLWTSTVFLLIF